MSEIRKGNIMARACMIVAYDQSEAFQRAGSRTVYKNREDPLGYTTLNGDLACAFNPIGGLTNPGLAIGVFDRDPTYPQPNLLGRPVGGPRMMEGELGFTHAEVDKLLYSAR